MRPPRARPFGGERSPPKTAEEGAKRILAQTVEAFDPRSGDGADWQLVAESLFRAAFQTLGKLEADARLKMARRVHAGAYERVLASDAAAGEGGFPITGPQAQQPGPPISPQLGPDLPSR